MKKFISMALFCVCAVSLVACGNKPDNSSKSTNETSSEISKGSSDTNGSTTSKSKEATKKEADSKSSESQSPSTSRSDSKEDTPASGNKASEQSNTPIPNTVDKSELLTGDYTSLNGTWRNAHGYQLVFNNGTITAPIGSAENTQDYSLVSPTDASNVIFLSFSPAPAPNGMSIMIGLKGSPAEVNGNSDGTDTTKDRILMGNNGGTLLFAPKDQGGIPDTAYYRE